MPSILIMLLRRLRAPLILLVSVYAVSVLGFVLIPGQDDQGNPWRMDFFYAFYFVSYMGTTIGFGEIPYAFTTAQRFWTLCTIYGSVMAWLYGIGVLLSIVQDQSFRRLVQQSAFERQMRHLKEPFYLVCGYGDTGALLVRALTSRGNRVVVLDIDKERIDHLEIEDYNFDVPALVADAAAPQNLLAAGLRHHSCQGLVAVTNDDQANLSIALSGKLLAPGLMVICRAEHEETKNNMISFGTDHVINPYETFADLLGLAIHSPHMHALYRWLTNPEVDVVPQPLSPPRGSWLVCGYGRFGKAVYRHLQFEGVKARVIEVQPKATDTPPGMVEGKGTEAATLRLAGVMEASAIVAGTDNGADNLSILMTARELNPQLFTVVRQTLQQNTLLFEAAKPDLIAEPAQVMARKVLALIQNPLLADFLKLARQQNDHWAEQLLAKMTGWSQGGVVDSWGRNIDMKQAPAVCELIKSGQPITLGELLQSPRDRSLSLPIQGLVLKRGKQHWLLPGDEIAIERGDQLLLGGTPDAALELDWTLNNYNTLEYVVSGRDKPVGLVWRWLGKVH